MTSLGARCRACITLASGTALPLAMAARCSSPVRQWCDSAARPRLGTAMVGAAKSRPAAAQELNASLKALLKADSSLVLKPDLSTDLNIGLRIELSMERGIAADCSHHAAKRGFVARVRGGGTRARRAS